MTWTVRSVVAFGVALFAVTLTAEGLYHLIGTPICESTPTQPVRCSQESGWWALVLGLAAIVAIGALRALRQPVVRRLTLGAALLGLGLAPLWATVDDRTDATGWAIAGATAAVLGVALLAGLAAAALRARGTDPLVALGKLATRKPASDAIAMPGEAAESPGSPAAPATIAMPGQAPARPGPTVASAGDDEPVRRPAREDEPVRRPPTGDSTIAPAGGDDPFGREPGEGSDPFGREE